MYADDTNSSLEGTNLSLAMQIMNPELKKVSLWLYRNQLTLNVLKTHYSVFHTPRNFPPNTLDSLFIGGSEIERVFECTCVVVNLDTSLKVKLHIHDVVKKTVSSVQMCYSKKEVLLQ